MISERIKDVAEKCSGSETKLAELLGLKQAKLNYYRNKSPDNLWPLLPKILELFPDIRRDWLYFGEGEMVQGGGTPALAETSGMQPAAARQPVQGSPAASVQLMLLDMRSDGWGAPAPIPALTALPELHDKMVAVVAPDDGLLPAGVGKGQVYYCDAAIKPQEGEPALVRLADGRAALLVYAGRDGGSLRFMTWEEDGTPRELAADEGTAQLAPVVLVRRRM